MSYSAAPAWLRQILCWCFILGEGYDLSLNGFRCAFWARIQRELSTRVGSDPPIGIAVLQYYKQLSSVVFGVLTRNHPETTALRLAGFPIQQNEFIAVVEHVLSIGVKPENLYLAGDLDALTPTLHPLPSVPVPASPLHSTIGDARFISPYIDLRCTPPSLEVRGNLDLISRATFRAWGQAYLSSTLTAPDGWFDGIGTFVKRFFISVGANEGTHDDIIEFRSKLRAVHLDVWIEKIYNNASSRGDEARRGAGLTPQDDKRG
ncbi:hypothetical protein BV22DRAFT_1050598 [Leucogyrophana mollusca]|uniref:Uncharacterized protein n=1 Tax=Leucogyrophana mollusca TaxID=85980 RepID=A0ACB8B337_9AGAM|nr:hypothetical protein BV22DRAFT_1050598 [Leucogyrophana mollusca]